MYGGAELSSLDVERRSEALANDDTDYAGILRRRWAREARESGTRGLDAPRIALQTTRASLAETYECDFCHEEFHIDGIRRVDIDQLACVACDDKQKAACAALLKPYAPILSPEERSAYVAAHRIINDLWGTQLALTGESEFVFAGTRRSRTVDRVAALILEAM